jgi:hypothetical protein
LLIKIVVYLINKLAEGIQVNFKKVLSFLLLIGFYLLFSCSGKRNYSIETKNGIQIIHNRQPMLSEPAAHLEFVRRIGEMESEDENLMFVFPIHAARDGDGNLYVLDSRDYCIKKFDRDGNLLLKFGRQGQGPGEFQYPMLVGIAGEVRLIVQCMDSTYQIFDLKGQYIDRFAMGRYDGLFMRVMRSGNVVGYSMNVGGENSRKNFVLKIFDLEGKTLHQFGEPLLMTNTRDSWNVNFLSISLDKEDNIYASFAYQNRIEKYSSSGELLMTIERELQFPVEHKTVKETMEIGGKARQVERLKSTVVSRGIGIDKQNRIWVLGFIKQVPEITERDEFIPQEYNVFEIYNPKGVLLCHVPLPGELKSFDNFVMFEDTIYFIDPYGECCVFEYRIIDS